MYGANTTSFPFRGGVASLVRFPSIDMTCNNYKGLVSVVFKTKL